MAPGLPSPRLPYTSLESSSQLQPCSDITITWQHLGLPQAFFVFAFSPLNFLSSSSCMNLMRHMGSCPSLPVPFTNAESIELRAPYTWKTIPFSAFVSCSKLQFTLQHPDQISTPLCSPLCLPHLPRQTFVLFFLFLFSLPPSPYPSSSPLSHLPKGSECF